jgi:hypothetical protein
MCKFVMFTPILLYIVNRYMLGINWPSWDVQVVMLKEPAVLSFIIALDELYVLLCCCHARV